MKRLIFIVLILFVTILTSCSAEDDESQFNDNDIKISLLNEEIKDEYRRYSIEVINTGKLEIKFLNFYLYYPVITANGSKGNPFKIEGVPDNNKPIKLKSGEKIKYTIVAPIKEVFGDSRLLDFDNPHIVLSGFVQVGGEDIPFEMGGGYFNMM